MIGGDGGHADDAVHRRAHVVAHAGQEVALGLVGGVGGVDGVPEHLLDLLLLADLLVHVLEAGHDAGLAAGQGQLGKLHAVVARAGLKHPAEGHRVDQPVLGIADDVLRRHRLQESLPVLLQHQLGVEREGVGEAGEPHGHIGGQQVHHVLVDPVQLELLGLDVADQPHRVIDAGQRLDDGGTHGLVGFRPLPLFGDVRYEHVEQAVVDLGLHVVAVVVDPANAAVSADDAVLLVVLIRPVFADLAVDGGHDPLVIRRVHHAPEGEAGQRLEFLQGVAAEQLKHRLVGVQQFLARIRPVDEEAAGQVFAKLLDDRKALLVQYKVLAEHGTLPHCFKRRRHAARHFAV